MYDKQVKDVLERIKVQADKKEFKINTAEEWYYVSGLWLGYVFKNMKGEIFKLGRRQEAMRLAAQKDEKHFRDLLCGIFKTEYMKFDPSDKADGLFAAIVNYGFEESEISYDGTQALSQGLVSEF
jgi:hypothetical protein